VLKAWLFAYLVVAVLVASAATAAPALAGEEYFVEKAALPAAETVEGAGSAVTIQVEWNATTKLLLECTASKLQGASIETMGKAKEELVLEGCKNNVAEIKNNTRTSLTGKCEVSNTPTLAVKGQLGTSVVTGMVLNLLTPAMGAMWGEVEIKEVAGGGGCAYGVAAGTKYKVTETAESWFGLTGEEENIEHELILLPCQSAIKFEGKRAFIQTTVTKIKLSGGRLGKKWSVVR
jgi:hypothetical protein